nr:unnamed protein product [uncultured bacterium]
MKAIIYSRVSSLGNRQNTESQIKELTEVANNRGWEVVKVFSERISGAKSNADRNVLNECFEFAKNNGIDVIMFAELSRLGRSIKEVQKSVNWFADNKINAYFHNNNTMLLKENGEMDKTMFIIMDCLALVAEIERENIKYRLNRGRELAKEKGVKMGRKNGTTENLNDKEKKYPNAMRLLRKGYALSEIESICKTKGENVSVSTLKRLKKLIK